MVRLDHRGISLPDDDAHDVTGDITVEGTDEGKADKVLIHAKDEIVRAMQALEEGKHPEECDGTGVSINWDGVLEDLDEQEAKA